MKYSQKCCKVYEGKHSGFIKGKSRKTNWRAGIIRMYGLWTVLFICNADVRRINTKLVEEGRKTTAFWPYSSLCNCLEDLMVLNEKENPWVREYFAYCILEVSLSLWLQTLCLFSSDFLSSCMMTSMISVCPRFWPRPFNQTVLCNGKLTTWPGGARFLPVSSTVCF